MGSVLNCIGWIIIGVIAGGLARQIMGERNGGCLPNLILGIVGAFVGGLIVNGLGIRDNLDIGLGLGSLVTALIGAVALIAIGRFFSGRQKQKR